MQQKRQRPWLPPAPGEADPAVDGISRLRNSGAGIPISLRDLADDLADYIAMRPETGPTLDGLASFLAGLHTGAPAVGHGLTHVMRQLLPGEAADMALAAPPDRWVTVYEQLADAAAATGLGNDVQVHLLSRLMYWQTRATDTELSGRRAAGVPAP